MAELIIDAAVDAVVDTIKIFPFLYVVYLFIEYIEHAHSEKLSAALKKLGPFGPIGGALLGCIPQCGFSAASANLYAGRMISFGTLIAVFAATSDEAVPLMFSDPQSASGVWKLILVKLIIGAAAGMIADLVIKLLPHKEKQGPQFEELCRDCDCEHHHIAYSALIHAVKITLFILVVELVLGIAFAFAGAETVARTMLSGSPLQPFMTALFGFIPNCAASVIITRLYLDGALTFGSCISGLCTGAGAGLIVLFKANRNLKENFVIMASLYAAAVLSGLVIDLIAG